MATKALFVPRRLRATESGTPWWFGSELKKRGVPTETVVGEQKPLDFGKVTTSSGVADSFRVPPCCAEVYFASLETSNDLHRCAATTVAKLAADVYFEEVKRVDERRVFALDTAQYVRLKSKLGGGPTEFGLDKRGRKLFMLTRADAEDLGLEWR